MGLMVLSALWESSIYSKLRRKKILAINAVIKPLSSFGIFRHFNSFSKFLTLIEEMLFFYVALAGFMKCLV